MAPPPQRKGSRKREITFDPEARKEHLRGFSDRKRQRRAFGLAMQKCKDRKGKLHERKETRKAELERIEEAERLKDPEKAISSDNESDDSDLLKAPETIVTYQDVGTTTQFGGAVVVTTTTAPLEEESEDETQTPAKHSVDVEQRYAGHVGKFLNELKGHMPSKKNRGGGHKHRGKHGAASMRGMGGAADVKMAQKTLSKYQGKQTPGGGDRKKKRGKKR